VSLRSDRAKPFLNVVRAYNLFPQEEIVIDSGDHYGNSWGPSEGIEKLRVKNESVLFYKALSDENPDVRRAALDDMIKASSDKDPDVRRVALEILGDFSKRMVDDEAMDAMLKASSDEDRDVRFTALKGLAESRYINKQVMDALLKASSDEDPEVRFFALDLLHNIMRQHKLSSSGSFFELIDEEAIGVLSWRLLDEVEEIRELVQAILTSLGTYGNLSPLLSDKASSELIDRLGRLLSDTSKDDSLSEEFAGRSISLCSGETDDPAVCFYENGLPQIVSLRSDRAKPFLNVVRAYYLFPQEEIVIDSGDHYEDNHYGNSWGPRGVEASEIGSCAEGRGIDLPRLSDLFGVVPEVNGSENYSGGGDATFPTQHCFFHSEHKILSKNHQQFDYVIGPEPKVSGSLSLCKVGSSCLEPDAARMPLLSAVFILVASAWYIH